MLSLGSMATPESLQRLRHIGMTNFGANMRSPTAIIEQVLATIAQEGCLTVEAILNRYAGSDSEARTYLSRTLVYLVKFDSLRLAKATPNKNNTT